MRKRILVIVAVIVVVAVIGIYTNSGNEVNDFESCIAAGNPAMESYPRQCRDASSDRTFVEVIDDVWRLDNIILMQHESEGYYGCFGCGNTLCVDPIMEMKLVDESAERYCSSDFEVVE